MDLTAIIFFIIIILAVMIMAYIPFELQTLAKKADFGSFSLRYMILKIQKVPIKYLLEQYEKLADNDIEEDFDDLVKLWKSNPEELKSIINFLTEGKNSGTTVTLNDVFTYKISEKNYKRFIQVLKITNESNEEMKEEILIKLINSDIDISIYFELTKNAKKYNFKLPKNQINSENLNDLLQITEHLKTIKDAGFEYNDEILENENIDYRTKAELLSIIPDLNKFEITVKTKDIIKLKDTGINIKDLTEAIVLLKTEKINKITEDQIIKHYLCEGNGLRVVKSFIHAHKLKLDIKPDILFKLDLDEKENYDLIVDKCINTYDYELLPPVKVLLKNGIQVSPQIIITAGNNINSSVSDPEKVEQIKLINKIVSKELEKFSSPTDILKKLKDISQKIESKILKKDITKDQFTSFSINIIDLKINKDTLKEIKKSETQESVEKEKLKLLKAKRKLEEDMAKAVEKGKLSYNDYLKEKYIFNDDDKDLPYHTD